MYNKKLMVSLFAGVFVIAAMGALVFFKGDVLLFAITNSAQVRAEATEWNHYVSNYGKEAVLPKE